MSELWRKTAALLGTSTNSTTSYHPQSNGMVERMHRTMKAALKAKLESDPNWIDVLPSCGHAGDARGCETRLELFCR